MLPPGVPEWARQSCGTNRNGDRFGAADLLRVARTVAAETGDELAVELAAQEYQLADHEMSAEALERNADRYRCHFGVFEGEVVEIQDVPGGGSVLQLRMPRTRAQLVAFAFVAPAASVVRGTTARVYGFGAGLQTSTDRALTLPRIDATAVVPNSVERHPSEATVRAVNAARTQR